ncbi:hypothetical protein G5C60_23905 [Streptomyces sp. HC44]|uniref:Secreted protein n=1 Tax=Streptomyces scabichelini TaxID=2711217 RepID=A0A6G4V9R3_9ACTN|nr:DUF6082 family protein [Streptomyces scabichelini]NGO10554.1 hypothetical protein [Streptomyces scabichelini]
MATLTLAARRIGSAVVTGLGRMRVPFARDGRRQRQDELVMELCRQVALVAEELHRANLIQQHRLFVEQLDRAIDDPSLAAALSTLSGLSERRRRQMLFANREYGVLLLAHRVGTYSWDELLGQLRILCRNDVFAEYWASTVEHRRSLPGGSLEKQVGGVVDAILEELADDPDEWWVVGPEPEPEPSGE